MQAFYDLYELADLSRALKIIFAESNIDNYEVLHNQLGTWGYYNEQIKLYKKLIGKFDTQLNAFWLASISNSLNAQAKYEEAIKHCHEALELLNDSQNNFIKTLILVNLGNSHYYMGNFIDSIKYQTDSLKIAQKIDDKESEMNALVGLGNSYQAIGEYKTAIEYYKESLIICENKINSIRLAGQIIGNLGNSYQSLGDYENAVNYHQRSLEIARKNEDRLAESNALGNLSVDYCYLKDYENTIDNCQKSIYILQDLENIYGEMLVIANLANAYAACENYVMAINYQEKALLITREIQHYPYEGLLLFNLGNSYYWTHNFIEAIKNYEKALEIMRKVLEQKEDFFKKSSNIEISNNVTPLGRGTFDMRLIDRKTEIGILGDIANSYMMLKQFDRAVKYCQEALEVSRKIKDREMEARILQMLEFIYGVNPQR